MALLLNSSRQFYENSDEYVILIIVSSADICYLCGMNRAVCLFVCAYSFVVVK